MKRYFFLFIFFTACLCPGYAQENATDKTVLLAILARNKAHVLPLFLQCIENLDYDKKLISIYINTNNNCDETEDILKEWTKKHEENYRSIVYESHEIENLEQTNPHDWNPKRWSVLGRIRNQSLLQTKEQNCDFYFVVDCDNFLSPCTLKTLVSKDKPMIAPMLKGIPNLNDVYSNFFCDITPNGYYKDHPDYFKIFYRSKVGTFPAPLVHHVYLIKAEVLDKLSYADETNDWEFIIFARSARNNGVQQYICNERDFGYFVHFDGRVSLEDEKRAFDQFIVQHGFFFDPVEGRIPSDNKRYPTFKKALELMKQRNLKTIVETGSARLGEAGSTVLFADWASQHGGKFYSINISQKALKSASQAILAYQDASFLIQGDAATVLGNFPEKIDFLYLDSSNYNADNTAVSQKNHLQILQAAYDKLSPSGIVMIDDCLPSQGGQGKEVISFLEERGWEVLLNSYQVILGRKRDTSLGMKIQLHHIENKLKNVISSDEAFDLLLQLAKIQEEMPLPESKIVEGYKRASHYSFKHAEPYYYLCRYLRLKERFQEAYEAALEGLRLSQIYNVLPLETWIYERGMAWEFSLCAYSAGYYKESIDAAYRVLLDPGISTENRKMMQKNLVYYQACSQIMEFAVQKWGTPPWESSKKIEHKPYVFKPAEKPQLHVWTMATQRTQGLDQLETSCAAHHVPLVVDGIGENFNFGLKLQLFKKYVAALPDDDVVLFLDAYDTLVLADQETFLKKFKAFNAPCVVSVEVACHPFPNFCSYFPSSPTRFKYLNSGAYMGYVWYIKQLLEAISPIPDETDDQGLLSVYYLYHPNEIKLDTGCELFLSLFAVEKHELILENGKVTSVDTGSKPCVVHGNSSGKALYQELFNQIYQ